MKGSHGSRQEEAEGGPLLDVDALRAGEARAAEVLYRTHARTVLRWVIRLGGPSLDAEDVAHDVFAIALGKVHQLLPGAPVEPWLFGVTRRVVANARRRARFRRWIGLDDAPTPLATGPGADVRVDQLRRRRIVQGVLEQLGDAHRETLVLVDLDGRTAPEVADILQISVGTVYSRVHHARKRFAEILGAQRSELEMAQLRSALISEEP